MNFSINANHQRSQPTPSHCAMYQYLECLLLLLLLELLIYEFATLPSKAKWEVNM